MMATVEQEKTLDQLKAELDAAEKALAAIARVKRSDRRAAMGAVFTNAVYPLAEFQRLVGLSRWAFVRAERSGLKIAKVGRRKYVRGADWDAFLSEKLAHHEH